MSIASFTDILVRKRWLVGDLFPGQVKVKACIEEMRMTIDAHPVNSENSTSIHGSGVVVLESSMRKGSVNGGHGESEG
jgi:hypothetical protein